MRPRNGPPLAVRTMRLRSPASAHWKSAECSLSTGINAPPPALARGERQLAGGDEALLVGERERDAALERPHRPRQPGESERRRSGRRPARRARAARSGRLRPASAARARRSASSPTSPRRARARDSPRSPRSPGARSTRWRRGARPASWLSVPRKARCPVQRATPSGRRRGSRSTPPARRRTTRRGGRACRRGRRGGVRCPSRPRRASGATRTGRRAGPATASTDAERRRLRDREEVLLVERDERDEDVAAVPKRTPPRLAGRRAAPSCAARRAARRSTRACRRPTPRAAQ